VPSEHEGEVSPLAVVEIRDATLAAVDKLSPTQADTVRRLLVGAGAPEGVDRQVWWTRCFKARDAFREAYRRLTVEPAPCQAPREETPAWTPAPAVVGTPRAVAPFRKDLDGARKALQVTDDARRRSLLSLTVEAREAAIAARPELADLLARGVQ